MKELVNTKLQFCTSLFGVLFFVFTWSSRAQSDFQFLVHFSSKTESQFSANAPENFLSNKAIQRRTKHNVSVTLEDIPVVQRYLDSLSVFNLEATSKWFNCAVISTSDSLKAEGIVSLPFVDSVQFIGWKGGSNKTHSTNWDYGPAEIQTDMVNGKFLHQKDYTGKNVLITVIDAGFSNANSMSGFDSLYQSGRLLATYDFVENETDVVDDPSHGTSVLSLMATHNSGVMMGTAPNSDYILLVSEDVSQENLIEEFHYIEALEFADSAGTDIVNTSLGYNEFDSKIFSHTKEELTGDSAWITKATNIAARKGILMVTSAGNEGNAPWRVLTFPADADSVLTVGAVNSSENIGGFSSVGLPSVNKTIKPNIVAQGAQAYLVLGNGGYTTSNGTSFSSPQIAGWAACLMQAFPDRPHWEIKQAIEYSAHQYSAPDSIQGHGIPDFELAYYHLKYNGFQNLASEGILIFPNPTGNLIEVVLEKDWENIEVINSRGQLVRTFNVSGNYNQFTLGDLSQGIYFLKFNTSGQSMLRKVMVK